MWDNLGKDVYTGGQMWKRTQYITHMKSKGRWQILKFIDGSTDKYKVVVDRIKHRREVLALLKLIKES